MTSQIFANIYLNELDRFVMHGIRPIGYVRYGDDFIIVMKEKVELDLAYVKVKEFLFSELSLELNPKNDIRIPVSRGIHFLGVVIFAKGRKLKNRSLVRATTQMSPENISSYRGLIHAHSKKKVRKQYDWDVVEYLRPELSDD